MRPSEAEREPFAYDLFGFHLHSELELPELHPAETRDSADVTIRRGPVPDAMCAGTPVMGLRHFDGGAVLEVEQVARYAVRGGREIIVDAHPGAPDRTLRLFLLGSALGVVLHQRGLLPLHANAIGLGGQAIAFVGHSGAGKSTMAAYFNRRGHRVLADDVCVVSFDETGAAVAHPGIPRLRLWQDAIESVGGDVAGYDPVVEGHPKYNVPIESTSAGGPVPLRCIYLLRRTDAEADAPVIRRLAGLETVDALVANTYRGMYLRVLGGAERHLHTCLKLAEEVPVFELSRAWGHHLFEQQMGAIAAHAESVGA